jgi:hypothetical protein
MKPLTLLVLKISEGIISTKSVITLASRRVVNLDGSLASGRLFLCLVDGHLVGLESHFRLNVLLNRFGLADVLLLGLWLVPSDGEVALAAWSVVHLD